MNKLELLFFGKQIFLEKKDGKIIIIGGTWSDFRKMVIAQTHSGFELTKYNFLNVKKWDDIIEYFTYLQWNPNIKVITKLDKKKHTTMVRGNLIVN